MNNWLEADRAGQSGCQALSQARGQQAVGSIPVLSQDHLKILRNYIEQEVRRLLVQFLPLTGSPENVRELCRTGVQKATGSILT